MPYTSEKPIQNPSSEELKGRIPGWGVDLDPKDRPGVPREKSPSHAPGAHWDFPERQPEHWTREKSVEHMMLPPVFGTSCPPKGLSGAIRRVAYDKYSEGTNIHWLLLIAADRVDAAESRMGAWLAGNPDHLLEETGVLSEFRRGGIRSRLGRGRADLRHQALDPVLRLASYGLMAGAFYWVAKSVAERR